VDLELEGKRIAVLVQDEYADLEFWYPALRLRETGAEVTIVGTAPLHYLSRHGLPIQADIGANQVGANDFDAIVIPGGEASDSMQHDAAMVALVHNMEQAGKVIAAISYAGQAMTSAHDEHDEHTAQFFGLKAPVQQAAGPLAKSAVIREGNLITARPPINLPAFCRMIIAALVALDTTDTTPVEPIEDGG
jgi:protease I